MTRAILHWDFTLGGWPGVRIHGSLGFELERAQRVCAEMTKQFGAGTHWVEVLNSEEPA